MSESSGLESAEVPRKIVVAGVVVRDGKILVVTNVKRGERIEPPGGKWEASNGESLEQAVIRELKEELEIDVAVGPFIGAYDTDSSEDAFVVHTFLCEIVAGEPRIAEGERTKLRTFDWLTPDELEALPILTQSLRLTLPDLRELIASLHPQQ